MNQPNFNGFKVLNFENFMKSIEGSDTRERYIWEYKSIAPRDV